MATRKTNPLIRVNVATVYVLAVVDAQTLKPRGFYSLDGGSMVETYGTLDAARSVASSIAVEGDTLYVPQQRTVRTILDLRTPKDPNAPKRTRKPKAAEAKPTNAKPSK